MTSVKHPLEHQQTLVSPAALIQPIRSLYTWLLFASLSLYRSLLPERRNTRRVSALPSSFPPSLVHFLPFFLPVGLVRPLISACTVIGILTCLQLVWQAARQQYITHMKKCNHICVNLINWIKNTSFCCNILHPCFGSVNASVWTLDGAVGAAVRRHQNVSLCEFEKWH